MRLFEIESSKINPLYAAPSKKYHKAGITLYHTTPKRNAKNILEKGLKPKANRHEIDRYHDLRLSRGTNAPLPPSERAIFTFPKYTPIDPNRWAEGPDSEMKMPKFPEQVTFGFVTNETDVLGTSQYMETEILVFNIITPDRLFVM